MNLHNDIKNQHYISQAEQRLNSYDNQKNKIYKFNIINNDTCEIALEKEVSIRSNLSFNNLFSLNIITNEQQLNLEKLFDYYENKIFDNTLFLLKNLSSKNIEDKIIEIFYLKFINSLRNPYSIRFNIEIFGYIAKFKSTNKKLIKIYQEIKAGNKPQLIEVCEKFEITQKEYQEWTRMLFMLLIPIEHDKFFHRNLLENFVHNVFFENFSSHVNIYTYSNKNKDKPPLLSDRGFSLVHGEGHISYLFNLDKNAFIIYHFCDKEQIHKKYESMFPNLKNQLLHKYLQEMKVQHEIDNLEMLVAYNKNVVGQAKKNVFSHSKCVYGIT